MSSDESVTDRGMFRIRRNWERRLLLIDDHDTLCAAESAVALRNHVHELSDAGILPPGMLEDMERELAAAFHRAYMNARNAQTARPA